MRKKEPHVLPFAAQELTGETSTGRCFGIGIKKGMSSKWGILLWNCPSLSLI